MTGINRVMLSTTPMHDAAPCCRGTTITPAEGTNECLQLTAPAPCTPHAYQRHMPQVTRRKAAITASQPKLLDLLHQANTSGLTVPEGQEVGQAQVTVCSESGEVCSNRYHLLPVDLRNLDGLNAAIQRAGFDLRCVRRLCMQHSSIVSYQALRTLCVCGFM